VDGADSRLPAVFALGRGTPGPPGQLGHGRLRQRLQRQAADRLLGQAADEREERMVGCGLVVAVGDDQQRLGLLHPSSCRAMSCSEPSARV
jgi:hypothetical protein